MVAWLHQHPKDCMIKFLFPHVITMVASAIEVIQGILAGWFYVVITVVQWF